VATRVREQAASCSQEQIRRHGLYTLLSRSAVEARRRAPGPAGSPVVGGGGHRQGAPGAPLLTRRPVATIDSARDATREHFHNFSSANTNSHQRAHCQCGASGRTFSAVHVRRAAWRAVQRAACSVQRAVSAQCSPLVCRRLPGEGAAGGQGEGQPTACPSPTSLKAGSAAEQNKH
jgi:hypothetical protein